jgi:hypothetical protein
MIKYPGGEIAFWSILFFVAGAFVSYTTFADGKIGLGCMFAMLPVGCALIWLDMRPAKWLVVTYLGIATFGAIAMLFANGFTTSLAIRGALAAYGAFQFAIWDGGPNSDRSSA